MKSFKLTVLAAEKPFYDGDCVSLVIPTIDGQYGVLANHCNTIVAIATGVLRFTAAGGTEVIAAVSDGIVKIENNEVLILVDTVELPEEIDENRARLSTEQAKEMILQKKSFQDYYLAQAKMTRAINRLKVKKYTK